MLMLMHKELHHCGNVRLSYNEVSKKQPILTRASLHLEENVNAYQVMLFGVTVVVRPTLIELPSMQNLHLVMVVNSMM